MRRRKKNWIPQTPLWHNDCWSEKSQGSSAKRSEVKVENIRIADRSENGWATVKEYEGDELLEVIQNKGWRVN